MIKKLVVQGFKSFNRKLAIPFKNGITIITGPNGSGKSNIIDAICFVLGRTSAKSMRADRLAELIFHGSNNKKPAEYAYVSIHLDNSQKIFPYEEEEVIITRKVNRKGFTIYKINGITTTREKVLQVLSMARIYPDGHNIVMQGDIENIIEMNPLERKAIIDEICGIAEYNEKKEKALRDLEIVNQRLKEVEIILNQKNEILKKLEKDKEAVDKFRKLQSRLTLLKASYWKKKENIINKNLESIDKTINNLNSDLQKVQEEINKIENEIEENEKTLRNLTSKLIEATKDIEREREFNQLEIIKTKIEIKRREIERINNEIEKISLLKEKIEKEEMPVAVKAILDLDLKDVYGTFSSIIKYDENLENAIRVACANHFFDLVVENFSTAKLCIEYLKENKIGRATFLPLDKIKSESLNEEKFKNIEGFVGVASNLVKFDEKFRDVVNFVLGNTLIIENLHVAEKIGIGKYRMVTIDGDLIERSGAVTGGYLIRKSKIEKESLDINKLLQEKSLLEKELEELEKNAKELENNLKKYSEIERKRIDVEEIEKIKKDSLLLIEKLKEKRRILIDKKIKVQNEINKFSLSKVKIETELEKVKIELSQYKDIQEFLDKSLDTLENEIKEVSQEIESLGTLNFKAAEEYEKVKTEYDKIFEKYSKIEEERNSVINMINEIENKRKDVFFSCLNAINKNFAEIFSKITGGEASLTLEQEGNIDSGLLIKASFGNKRLINIDLMSGGEKSLTALSFILAIQMYKPSKFYLFDEVDASLDKENTIKIYKQIRELAENSQFIIISHNEEAFRFADVLYGITMEDGESKIISLELPK